MAATAPLRVRDLHTRLLYPFFFARGRATEASAALSEVRIGSGVTAWDCIVAHDMYRDELLGHVTGFLFEPKGGRAGGCHYLRVASPTLGILFKGAVLRMVEAGGRGDVPLGPDWGTGIELLLTPHGVGLLSIAVRPGAGAPTDVGTAADFNYRLSRLPPKPCPLIHLRHPSDDPEAWARVPDADRGRVSPPPSADAPAVRRLGVPGGSFTVAELIEELLRPLTGLGLRGVQPELSIYTVARFGPEFDLDRSDVCGQAAPVLAAFAQVEEPGHAGVAAGTVPVANAVLNRRHWAAAGQLGAAHLIGDQPPLGVTGEVGGTGGQGTADHPFNAQRVPRVFLKYFVPYLLAQVQRLTLHRILDEAGEVIRANPADAPAQLAAMRSDLLRFGVGGHFTQVSTRDAVQRFYAVCRDGLGVPAAWEDVRRAVADIDAAYAAARQVEQSRDLTRNVGIVAHVQTMVEYIECFLISVYFAELVNVGFEAVKESFHGHEWFPWVHLASVLAAAGIAFAVAWVVLKPREQWRHLHAAR